MSALSLLFIPIICSIQTNRVLQGEHQNTAKQTAHTTMALKTLYYRPFCLALMVQLLLLLLVVSPQSALVSAFQTPSPQITPLRVHRVHYVNKNHVKHQHYNSQLHVASKRKDSTNVPFSSSTTTTSTQIQMYNLPPGGPNNNNDDNPLSQLLSGALVIGGIILFFASPLGSIFFAITNSLFLLALITPVVLTIAFQVWQSLNTVSGTCPNCGSPARIVKDPDQAGICFNCGTILQASSDGKSIEFAASNKGINGRGNDYIDMNNPGSSTSSGSGSSIFDSFFGGTESTTSRSSTSTSSQQQSSSSSSDAKSKASKFKREQTIIDVEVEKNKDDDNNNNAWQ